MSMVSCTEDYTDWGNPQSNSQEEAVAFGNGSVTPVDVINLADVATEKVKVASIVAPTSSDAAYTPNYKINFDGQSFDIDADGNMAKADLVITSPISMASVLQSATSMLLLTHGKAMAQQP